MKKILLGLAGAIVLLLAVLIANTLRIAPAPKAQPAGELTEVDVPSAGMRLAGALRIPTVTDYDAVDWSPFPKFHDYLRQWFPRVHAQLTLETVTEYSLLYTWQGADESLPPILLLAHQDVVPIEPGTDPQWKHPPFAGAIADGFIWGRGALDDKSSLMAQLEAVELLLAQGFRPSRTVYFAFGHDEEIGGRKGAVEMARLLESRGVKAGFSLDEGGAITRGVVAGVAAPVASIMTAEKGYLSLRLTTRDAGGHSSRPPPVSAVGRLAAAVARLEQNPLPTRLTPPVREMLQRLAPEYPLVQRLVIANLWLFEPLVVRQMTGSQITNAMVRTTTAPTIFNAGVKDNILPTEAVAVVNFRILPGESAVEVEAQVRRIISDPEVTVEREPFHSEPSPPASTNTAAFAVLESTVNEVFPEAVVTAGLVIGATDNRHYGAVYESRYNFLPVTITEDDLARIHGANERIAVADYMRMIQFYERLLRNAAGG